MLRYPQVSECNVSGSISVRGRKKIISDFLVIRFPHLLIFLCAIDFFTFLIFNFFIFSIFQFFNFSILNFQFCNFSLAEACGGERDLTSNVLSQFMPYLLEKLLAVTNRLERDLSFLS